MRSPIPDLMLDLMTAAVMLALTAAVLAHLVGGMVWAALPSRALALALLLLSCCRASARASGSCWAWRGR